MIRFGEKDTEMVMVMVMVMDMSMHNQKELGTNSFLAVNDSGISIKKQRSISGAVFL